MNNISKINSKHIFFIISGLCFISIDAYPSVITSSCQNDSWISLIIASILFVLFALLLLSISVKTNCFDITNIYKTAFGNKAGSFLLFLFFINAILVMVESSSLEANTINNNILVETPVWFILLFFIVPAIYTIIKGRNAVVITVLAGIALIIIANILSLALLAKSMHIGYLLPVLKNGFSYELWTGILKFLSLYSFIILAFPYIQEINKKDKLKKYVLIAIILISILKVLSIMQMISTLGIKRLNNIYYPKLIQNQLIDYFSFLENGEIYTIFEIVGGWFIKYIITFFSLTLMLNKLNIKNNKYIIFIVSIIVFVLSCYISADTIRLFKLLQYYIYICFFNFIAIPLLSFIIFYFRQKAKSSKTANN